MVGMLFRVARVFSTKESAPERSGGYTYSVLVLVGMSGEVLSIFVLVPGLLFLEQGGIADSLVWNWRARFWMSVFGFFSHLSQYSASFSH